MSSAEVNKKLNNLDLQKAIESRRSMSTHLISSVQTSIHNLLTPPPSPESGCISPHSQLSLRNRLRISRATTSKSENAIVPRRRDSSVEKIHHPKNYRARPSYHHTPFQSKKSSLSPNYDDIEQLHRKSNDFLAHGDQSNTSLCEEEPAVKKPTVIKRIKQQQHEDPQRKAVLISKVMNAFMYGAMKKQSNQLQTVQMRIKMKNEECAARLILHSLLLNSYNRTRSELEQAQAENVHQNKTVENLCLQLRVVRHLQISEKEKAMERTHEIGTLKSEIGLLKDELEISKKKLETIEKQLAESQDENAKLLQEKVQIQADLTNLQEKIDIVNGSLELEKKQVQKYEESAKLLKRQITESKHEVKELICQSSEWQERARTLESENWELKINIKDGETELNKLKISYHDLLQSNQALSSVKDKLYKKRIELEEKLQTILEESFSYQRNLTSAQRQLTFNQEKAENLQEILNRLQEENKEMRTELYSFKLKNLRRRRTWVHFVMKIMHPFETIRLFIFGNGQLYGAHELRISEDNSNESNESGNDVSGEYIARNFGFCH